MAIVLYFHDNIYMRRIAETYIYKTSQRESVGYKEFF